MGRQTPDPPHPIHVLMANRGGNILLCVHDLQTIRAWAMSSIFLELYHVPQLHILLHFAAAVSYFYIGCHQLLLTLKQKKFRLPYQ